jgi:hypothetical protein
MAKLVAAVLTAMCFTAQADYKLTTMSNNSVCADDAKTMYEAILDVRNERPHVYAFLTNMNSVVWFTNPDNSTVSIVVDTPVNSCMIYSGECLNGDCFLPMKNGS